MIPTMLRQRAFGISHEVSRNRAKYRDEGSLAWALDDLRLAWADLLDAVANVRRSS